jgi:hypothetical protein
MAAKGKYLTVAKNLKRELDTALAGFRSINVADLQERAKEAGGDGMHVIRDDGAKLLTDCHRDMRLTVFPALENAPQDGYVTVIRSGSRLATVLANLQNSWSWK